MGMSGEEHRACMHSQNVFKELRKKNHSEEDVYDDEVVNKSNARSDITVLSKIFKGLL